jgi:hypothetical protein
MVEKVSKARTVDGESLGFFRVAEEAWRGRTRDGRPLLRLPREILGWTETAIYFANVRACVRDGEALLVVELRTFDLAVRRELHPSEIDWCIPMAYAAASARERTMWKVGLGEGWSDSREVATLVFDASWRSFFADVASTQTLVVGEVGRTTGSFVQQLDRNLTDLAAFAGAVR